MLCTCTCTCICTWNIYYNESNGTCTSSVVVYLYYDVSRQPNTCTCTYISTCIVKIHYYTSIVKYTVFLLR